MKHKMGVGFVGTLLLLLGSMPARSQDTGFPDSMTKWVADPEGPVFEGAGGDAWDQKIRERGWVHVENGTFHLFYTGYNESRSPLRMLGHATSTDGIHWTRDPENPIHASSWVEDMCIVKRDGSYYMYPEGENDIAHLLTSTDLRHWKERGPLDIRKVNGEPISPGPRGTPFVLVEDGTWNLFYERGDRGVWLARSQDGTVWTNASDDPVLPMGPEKYDLFAVAVNQVVKRDGIYYAWYHANSRRPWADWTTCLARSKDLVHWEKFPGNPVLDHNWSSAVLVDGPNGTHLYTMHPSVRRFANPK